MTDRIEIRSYRRVFRVDRRVYRVDRWAIPIPGGIPLSGAAYFGFALLAVVLLEQLPLIGDILDLLAAPLRYVILPAGLAVLTRQATPDGRTATAFAWSWLQLHWVNARRDTGTAWTGKVRARWDADSPRLRRCQIHGPAVVRFRVPVQLQDRWNGWWAEGGHGEPRTVEVPAGRTLKARS